MLRYRLSDAAQIDVIAILARTHEQFGEAARLRYESLIVTAFRDVATQHRPAEVFLKLQPQGITTLGQALEASRQTYLARVSY